MQTETEYIGVIGRTHGTDGAVLLVDVPTTRVTLNAGDSVAVGFTMDFARRVTVAMFQATPQRTIIRFSEISTPEAASELIDNAVYVAPSHIYVSPDDRYSLGEIEGCTVIDRFGAVIGVVKEVWLLPANDVWLVVTEEGLEIPLPVIDQVVKTVNVSEKTIVVEMMEGLADLSKHSENDEIDE